MKLFKNTIFLIVTLFSAYASAQCTPDNCLIVIDAGSSGSRAHVYQYSMDANKHIEDIQEIISYKIKPGVSELNPIYQDIDGYLTRLMKPLASFHSLPVYFYATAGMRFFSHEEQVARYRLIEQWFQQHHFELQEAKTITGHQEGVFGWLSVNYLSGTLYQERAQIGLLDFGGGSTQIAFPLQQDSTALSSEDISTIILGNQQVLHVYAKSFLGLGVNASLMQFANDSSCYPIHYPLASGKLARGEMATCEAHLSILAEELHHISRVRAALRQANTKQWVALGALPYLHNSLPFQSLSSTITTGQISNLADRNACNADWYGMTDAAVTDPYLYRSCFYGAYYHALLNAGYGFAEDQAIDTTVQDKQIDWTYGVVIQHISKN